MFSVILNQTEMLVIYILIGVIGVKSGALSKDTLDQLSRYVMKIALPVMIFASSTSRITANEGRSALIIFAAAAVVYIVLFAAAFGFSKLFRLEKDRGRLYCALSAFGNIGFIGLPIIVAAFPERGILYLAIYSILDQGLLWTVGMKLSTPRDKFQKAGTLQTLKRFMNPAFAALILGAVRMFTGFPLPAILDATLTKVGATATPVSLIYIGGLFCYADISKYVRRAEYFAIAAFKMILVPILIVAAFKMLGLNGEIGMTLALLEGLPTVTALAMMANANGSDGDYAIGAIFITTIACIVTLPAVSYIAGMIM